VNERINEEFQINRPANVHFHTEKPNNNPYLLMKMRNEGRSINGVDYDDKLRDGNYKTELTSEINDKLKTVTHTPKDKWNVPQTSNQEIGWFADVPSSSFSISLPKILNLSTSEKGVPRRTTRTTTTRCATSPSLAISPRSDASYPLIIIKSHGLALSLVVLVA
jgi:hypothetical protein